MSLFDIAIIYLGSLIVSTITIYLLYKGVKKMARKVWRPKDKNKLLPLYFCTTCGVPFTAQTKLVKHMKDVHDKFITPNEAKIEVSEVSYEEWEAVRIDEESKLKEHTDVQDDIDERVTTRLIDNPDNDPEEIVPQTTREDPKGLYKLVSEKLEQSNISLPSKDLFVVTYLGDRVTIDISMTVPNTEEVIQAINQLNLAMGK